MSLPPATLTMNLLGAIPAADVTVQITPVGRTTGHVDFNTLFVTTKSSFNIRITKVTSHGTDQNVVGDNCKTDVQQNVHDSRVTPLPVLRAPDQPAHPGPGQNVHSSAEATVAFGGTGGRAWRVRSEDPEVAAMGFAERTPDDVDPEAIVDELDEDDPEAPLDENAELDDDDRDGRVVEEQDGSNA